MARNQREVPFMFRYYDKNGTLNVLKSLKEINRYYFPLTGRNLTELPNDDLDFL